MTTSNWSDFIYYVALSDVSILCLFASNQTEKKKKEKKEKEKKLADKNKDKEKKEKDKKEKEKKKKLHRLIFA